MRTVVLLLAAVGAFASNKTHKIKTDEWHPIFDGASIEGWKANEHPESWSVKDGAIRGDGPASHLFYMKEVCVNCEFRAEVRINHGGNSGMFFRTTFGPGFPKGYEAQVNSTHSDPVRTGSLYGFVKVLDQLVPDDTWFTQHVIVEGNHIQIFVNDKKTVDFIDENNTYTSGFVALQQHNEGSVVEYKNVMLKELPAPKSPLVGTWRLDRAQSKFSVGDLPQTLEIRFEDERNGLRYKAEAVMPDGTTHSVTWFARPDGYDYRMNGSADADHVSIEETNTHFVHDALRVAKVRKKVDERVFLVHQKMRAQPVGDAVYTISPDGQTLTREGTTKHAAGDVLQYKEILQKASPQ